MDNLGEAAKLYVYLKYIELALGILIAPFVIYFLFKIFKKVLKDS